MKDPKDLLMSALLPPDMLDDDDDKTQSDVVADVIVQYDFLQIIENIGKVEFEETYLNFIEDIKKQSFDNQRILGNHIINKVENIYDFSFPEKIIISDLSDIDDIYKFIEFLEYDNINFLVDVLKDLNADFINKDIYDFCKNNKKEIIKNINYYNKMNLPSIFINLRDTLEDDIIINMIGTMIYKNPNLVTNELKLKEFKI